MTALVILPESGEGAYLANFIDGPFLRHVIEFLTSQGIRRLLLVGSGIEQARAVLGQCCQWDLSIEYRASLTPSDYDAIRIPDGTMILLADAMVLPKFPLRQEMERPGGAILYGVDECWTGWAIVDPKDLAPMPPPSNRAAILSYLEGLSYAKLFADGEFRCASAKDLWKAHEDALDSNLSGIFHGGREMKPGVWIGRNASVAASAEITAPVYIGENSRVGSGTHIGPFASIGKDCLIAPGTAVRHAVIAPGTYAGDNLELDHVVVDRRRLLDIRFGVSFDNLGHPIADDVFDFHFAATPRRVLGGIASAVTSLGANVSSAWTEIKHACRPWRRGKVFPPPANVETSPHRHAP